MSRRDATCFSLGALALVAVFAAAEVATVWWCENRYVLGAG